MSKQIKDTDYLYLTALLRAREAKLVNRERVNRMIEAKTDEDTVKVLEECGYGSLPGISAGLLEERIAAKRAQVMTELSQLAPDPQIVDAFRVKYDYHNAKVLIKAEATGTDGEKLLSGSGRIPVKKLEESFVHSEFGQLPRMLASAMIDAKDTLARTGDPQLSDFILDKAYYQEFLKLAEATGSEFLVGYGRVTIDAANLRSAVRAVRMEKDAAFLRQVLVDGGRVSCQRILSAVTAKEQIAPVFSGSDLAKAAQAGDEALSGGRLTSFERQCDNALTAYLSSAKRATFDEKVLIYYICAVESELLTVRIIITGRLARLSAEAIRERLRDLYV